MNDDNCVHGWSETPEECETALLGTITSPICKHCGAVKVVEQARANQRARQEIAARPINLLSWLSLQPPRDVRVHNHQTKLFPET